MVLLGAGVGFFRRAHGNFRQSGLAGHRFGFRHVYPHVGYHRRAGGFFELHGQMAGRGGVYGQKLAVSDSLGLGHRRIVAGVFQSFAVGQRFAGGAGGQIQPGAGGADGGGVSRRTPFRAGMAGLGAGNGGRIDAGLETLNPAVETALPAAFSRIIGAV